MSKDKTTVYKGNDFVAFVDDQDTFDLLKKLPFQELDLVPQIQKGGVKAAHGYLKDNRSPAILLVDVSSSSLPISDVGNLAEVCEPGVNVIVIGTSNDVSIFRDLLKLGVKDYLKKPLNESLVMNTFKTFLGNELLQGDDSGFLRYGRLMTFLGAHGGVGTTTLATNLAWILSAEFHRRICVMDLDMRSGMVAHLLDQTPSTGLADMFSNETRVDQNLLDRLTIHVNDHLSILSSQDQMFDYAHVTLKAIQKSMSLLSEHYHYTIIDAPQQTTPEVMSFLLSHSQILVLVVDPTLFSVRQASLILEQLEHTLMSRQKVYVICNRMGEYKKGELGQETIEQTLKVPVDAVISFDDSSILEAANSGHPFATTNCKASGQIRSVAQMLTGGGGQKKPLSPLESLKQLLGAR